MRSWMRDPPSLERGFLRIDSRSDDPDPHRVNSCARATIEPARPRIVNSTSRKSTASPRSIKTTSCPVEELQLTNKEIMLVRKFLLLAGGREHTHRQSSSNLYEEMNIQSPYLVHPGQDGYNYVFKSDINKTNLKYIIKHSMQQENVDMKKSPKRFKSAKPTGKTIKKKKTSKNKQDQHQLKQDGSERTQPNSPTNMNNVVVKNLLRLPNANSTPKVEEYLLKQGRIK